MVFGIVTGLDPRTLPANERAADDLGLKATVAARLREIAVAEISAQRSAR